MQFLLIISLLVLAGHCVESAPNKLDIPSGKECLPGSSWQNQCNNCVCSSNGIAVCTLALCLGYENERVMTCAPDTMWKNDCNTCSCTTSGHASCTRMGCFHIP